MAQISAAATHAQTVAAHRTPAGLSGLRCEQPPQTFPSQGETAGAGQVTKWVRAI